MFDITDPFGTARIKELKYSMKVQQAEAAEEICLQRERAAEANHVAMFLGSLMEKQNRDLEEMRKAYRDMGQMLSASEEARKGLAEKNRKLSNDNSLLYERFAELSSKYDTLSEQYSAKEKELEEIYSEHAALVRGLRDSQAVSA